MYIIGLCQYIFLEFMGGRIESQSQLFLVVGVGVRN